MSWNNGLLSAHTPEEFTCAIGWALRNDKKSGILDLFGSCEPIVHPQECMITPSQIAGYARFGIDTLSVYYSAIPFNGFGCFVPKLSVDQRFNPLVWENKDTDTSMRVLPAINQGDLVEYGFSARRMIKTIRVRQTADLFILLDMDADDTFWAGMIPRPLRSIFPSFAGLDHLVRSIATLGYVRFIRPSEYLKNHGNKGTVTFGQDLADGAFDAFASWAEKWDNHDLWAKVTVLRSLWDGAKERVLCAAGLPPDAGDEFARWVEPLPKTIQDLAKDALQTRLRVLSTTHFGLSAPVMNTHHLQMAHALADSALKKTRLLEAAISWICPPGERAVAIARYTGQNPKITPETDGSLTLSTDKASWAVNGTWVTYHRSKRQSQDVDITASTIGGIISLGGGGDPIRWKRTFTVKGGSVYIQSAIDYPSTAHIRFSAAKADHLLRSWDGRWEEVAPCEITLYDRLPLERTVTVYKQDFSGQKSSYSLDYWNKNTSLASINNHVTPAWLAVSDGEAGLLIAQSSKHLHGFAAFPIRQVIEDEGQRITVNPLGTYWGAQYKYPLAVTGWGRIAASLSAEHLYPSAPSWAGKQIEFALLLVPYEGGSPPDKACALGEHFFSQGTVP